MPRHAPERRDELLEATIADLIKHGIAGQSLRPLAARVGVSTYSLSYHFGDKTQLLTAAVSRLVERLQTRLGERLADVATQGPRAAIEASWRFVLEHLDEERLLVEVSLLRGSELPETTRAAATLGWVEHVSAQLEARGMSHELAVREATLLQAVLLGLELDLIQTGDEDRTTQALETYACSAAERWTRSE